MDRPRTDVRWWVVAGAIAVGWLAPYAAHCQAPWRPIVATALVYEDWTQTLHMKGREMNPLLGAHPSNAKVTVACALAVLVNWIPWRHRDWVNGVTIGAETYFIISNALQHEPNGAHVGIRWRP